MNSLRRNRYIPALTVLLGLATLLVNSRGVGGFSFWSDEAYTVLAVRAKSWHEFLLVNLRNEETPPLYFALVRLWALAWGDSRETTLRLFSALCLAGAVPLVGLLGRRLWNWNVGLVSALLLAVNPFSHYYGQEARAYALALLLATVLLIAAQRYRHRPSVWAGLAYTLAGAATLYTNYLAAFMLASVGALIGIGLLYDFLQSRQRKELLGLAGWICAQIFILATLLPWLPGVRYQIDVSSATLAPEGRNVWLQYVLALLALGGALPDGSMIGASLIVLIAVALPMAGMLLLRYGSVEQRSFLLTLIVLPMIGVVLIFRGDGQFTPRYMLLSLPLYVIVLAAGLTRPWRWQGVSHGLLGAVIVLSAIYGFTVKTNPRRQGGWNKIAAFVAAEARPNDALFFAPPWSQAAFDVQYQGRPLQRYGASSFAHYYYEQGHPFGQTIDNVSLDRHLVDGERAWIVWDRIYATRPQAPAGARVQEYRFGSTSLLRVTPASAERPAHATSWSATVICHVPLEINFAGRTNEHIPCGN